MLFVKQEEYKRRLAICYACKFYEPTTKSCGPLIIGKEVTTEVKYKRKSIHLCGCVMPLKAKQGIWSCPASKWDAILSREEVIEIRKSVLEFNKKPSANRDEVVWLYELYSRLYGQQTKPKFCGSCVKQTINKILSSLPDLEEPEQPVEADTTPES